jgi:hypothetical protein
MVNKVVSTIVIIVKFCLAFIARRGRRLKENVALMWFDLGNSRWLSLQSRCYRAAWSNWSLAALDYHELIAA